MGTETEQQADREDGNEAFIADDEAVYWNGICNSKNRLLAIMGICVVSCAALFYALPITEAINELLIGALIGFAISFPVIVPVRKLITNKRVIVTAKKFAAEKKMLFWFTYDDVFGCACNRSLYDRMFGTATVIVTVVHTWRNMYGQIVRRAPGKFVLKDLTDAEGFMRALMQAKKDSGM